MMGGGHEGTAGGKGVGGGSGCAGNHQAVAAHVGQMGAVDVDGQVDHASHGASGDGQLIQGEVELGDYLEIGYFEQEMDQSVTTTCIEEIWQEFPAYSQYEVRSALAKCGLTTKHIESQVRVLSGGEQAKVRLCKLINRETNILLLDEPTNHLDVDAKDELKRALMEYKGSILMVCHEPDFYEGLATDVWDCSKWTTRLL